VLNKSDREGVDHLETQLEAMLELAPDRDGWKPKIVRTIATEIKGIDELAAAIAEYHEHFNRSADRESKQVEHWKRRLITLPGNYFWSAPSQARGDKPRSTHWLAK